jgi:RNA polymerase sigma factor (sigma-70 family)
VADVTQDVMTKLVSELPRFEHGGRAGAFRTWLRAVTVNSAREHWRKARRQPRGTGDTEAHVLLDELASDYSQAARQWDREHEEHVLRALMDRIRGEFDPQSVRAFECVTVRGLSAAEAAAELGMSPGAVYVAKSRVLRRLREEAAGLIDGV